MPAPVVSAYSWGAVARFIGRFVGVGAWLPSASVPTRGAVTPDSRDAGFTLLEIVVVLAIVGLMLGLVATRGPLRSGRMDLEAATRGMVGALRVARSQAIARNRPVAVTLTAHGYRVQGQQTVALPADIMLAGASEIRFAPDGSASGGRIVLHGKALRTSIAVDWLTGSIQIGSRG